MLASGGTKQAATAADRKRRLRDCWGQLLLVLQAATQAGVSEQQAEVETLRKASLTCYGQCNAAAAVSKRMHAAEPTHGGYPTAARAYTV
jgi:hypothetical protein